MVQFLGALIAWIFRRSTEKSLYLNTNWVESGMRVQAFTLLASLFLANAFAATPTETERIYDSRNRYQGKVIKKGGESRNYDKNNHYQGRSVTKDGETRYYDKNNHYLGKKTEHR